MKFDNSSIFRYLSASMGGCRNLRHGEQTTIVLGYQVKDMSLLHRSCSFRCPTVLCLHTAGLLRPIATLIASVFFMLSQSFSIYFAVYPVYRYSTFTQNDEEVGKPNTAVEGMEERIK